jgi:asparagine synthase (glutamine-hydrolysing)
MCGIAGIVGALRPDGADIASMLNALRHRGPDGEGIESDAVCALGHRRLSIIDLEGGRQPLHNAERTIFLVCNGEIYNYRELRAELEQAGHRFLTHSDCEVIIGLYERCGEALLERLRGMFAFALWDARRRRLFVARDHLGQKPLYYAAQGTRFAFASEIKGLLALDPALRQLNLEALDQYLALRLIAPPLSMYRGITKLPPGHCLTVEPGKAPILRRYWDLKFEPKTHASEEALLEELEEHIVESLRLHLVSDVPVGAFLSGGLDSSLLVALLVERLKVRELPTFTVGLPYRQFDEAPHALKVAERYGTDHHALTVRPSLRHLLADLVYHLDEPSDPLSLCTWYVAQLARRHVKVVIGGDGGDELFGGYDRYYGNVYAGYYGRIPAMLRRGVLGPALTMLPASGWYKSLEHQLKWLHRLSFLEGSARYAASLTYFYFDAGRRRELYTPATRDALAGFEAEQALRAPYDALRSADPIDHMLYADSQVRLPDHPVMISDRMTMAHGLEERSPFMDHRLAEFAATIPSSFKVRGRSLRYLQRKLAARYLPPEILTRSKQGFSSALPYILRDEYRSLYHEYLEHSELVRSGILAAGAVSALLGEHLAGRADHGNRLWLLINSEIWFRMMIQGEPRESFRREASPDMASAA